LYLITDDGHLALAQGEQVFKSAFGGPRADDPLDLAVLRLTGALRRGIEGRQLLGVEDVDPDETCAPDTVYVALGYPLNKVKIDRKNRTMTMCQIYVISRAKADAVFRSGRAVPANLAVELDRENMIVGRKY